ncbi:M81 family metallopeptidase [Paracoccus litorisediminis]|uniref:Microcystin degradation protein MlrC n=1 Tax=Paracoccus litorisediminis TaxID=2006130 RepID=A0A844HSG4_9RHOB|nr:M81 family metallopeptidase [Paracoccus litorisediminis]MTH60492.1 microcystin degradation protein MlrC [Paracoccus litorisediminis]
MRVAIGGIHTECSTYSPLMQVAADFTRTEGQALLDMAGVGPDWHGVEAVPIFHDRSIPGGPVSPDLFAAQCDEFCDRLRAALPLDGVLLIMHGAYFVPGFDDPEGHFVQRVREVVGARAVISSAWDLHGQITETIVNTVDAFAAFRTAPHVDQPQTRARAARMLLDALRGGPRPWVVRRAVPLLVSGEMSSTFVEPCQALYAALPDYDAKPGVCDANLMIGYVWADSPRATAAAVVTCTDRAAGQAAADAIARAYWDVREQLLPDMHSAPLESLLDGLTGPTVLADSGDNPTAGAVGDRADVLAALIARGWGADASRRALIVGIAAPGAVAALRRGDPQIRVGGELGGSGPQLELIPDAIRLTEGGAVVTCGGIACVLTERRRPFHDLADFAALGLDPMRADLVVVKSGYLSPDLRELPLAQVMALTDGAVSQDVLALPNNHRPRPIWPFQRDGFAHFI